ncbi:hypothetical protein [Massilia sp. Dwa41.01b]|uniref:hypothetical protein n=1 Tax=Massilia sp. Dwa41.01b TaxID=2709302 RepID=UPI001E5DEFA3|nr:hypothetical protein [Massilia sp. Dwa41.01b]
MNHIPHEVAPPQDGRTAPETAPQGKPRHSLGTWLALAFSLLSIFLTVLLVEVIDVAATREVEASIGNGPARPGRAGRR